MPNFRHVLHHFQIIFVVTDNTFWWSDEAGRLVYWGGGGSNSTKNIKITVQHWNNRALEDEGTAPP